MGRRSGRAAARRAAAALESTPKSWAELDDSDEQPVRSSPANAKRYAAAVPDEEEEEEQEGSAVHEDRDEDDDGSVKPPSPTPPPVFRRRRLGRPPKNRPPDWDSLPLEPPNRDPDATPRRRGRGGWRGRGGRKGQHTQLTRQKIDDEGNEADIINDEVDVPEDPEGETKVDKLGNLQGGREYRCRTFTVQGRGDRLYMLSTEPARCVGFRDSYLFFTKHKKLYKILLDDDEKKDMIDRDLMPHSYKGRSIGIVTARSVFREFGALIVVGGKRIIDDYYVAKLREEGVVEGELADPNDRYDPNKPYNKNQYVAWFGASAVYHSNAPTLPAQGAKLGPSQKRRITVNDVNWQLEHAREASQFNSFLNATRKAQLNGHYDVHTNMMQYPATMQPTRARIEQIRDPEEPSNPASSIFTPIQPQISRNFFITDTYLQTPPAGISAASYDLPFRTAADAADRKASDRSDPLASFRGLGSVSSEIRDLLPEDCKGAFDEARRNEEQWHARWGSEADSTSRKVPIIDKAIVPYTN